MAFVFLDLKLGTASFYQFLGICSLFTFSDFLPSILKYLFIIIFPCCEYDTIWKQEQHSGMAQSFV